MTVIDPVAGAATQVASAASSKKDTLGQKEFLELMITQLRNQDPFKPVDPTEFLGQLAQFGTVTGIQEMQGSLGTLADSLRSSAVLDGATLVGHDVVAASSTATLGAQGTVKGALDVPAGASSVTINVTDSSGQLVRRVQGSAQEGTMAFEWDGMDARGLRASPGNYRIEAIANVGGASESLETQLVSRVGSVTIDPKTYALTLNTELGPVALANVRRVM